MSGSVPLTTLPLFAHAARAARAESVEAERRKAEGMARAAENAGAVWRGYALTVLRELCERQRTVHSDDLRAACALTPPSPNAFGAIWQAALRKGWLTQSGQ
ncbi:MAG TPA: hypothetical protein VNM48_07560 [Chloroflexota bacterium]|nr:hypothetical protein [Chloroflexota bacterium]